MTYKKSELTKFIEAVNDVRLLQYDQYRATVFIIDAVKGTDDLSKLTYKTLRGAKANFKKAFNVESLQEYIEMRGLLRIEPFLCAQGDMLLIKDLHDDVAFNAGSRWLYFDDDNALCHDRFSFKHLLDESELFAFRIAEV
ncbi:hypothetical protein J4G57_05235 [Aeromonas caviae]|uniref:hypothetical protein n=1 Tax=Aeromonas TaxID=642 RepID=UPI000F79F116|nr:MULTISPECIES: hypothetical protein [Aeromonas]MBS4707296.1 hypothetical protein [Aeromonas caviae]RSM32305.1 hypothetical protein C5B78_01065 [Aeromonas salmonicida]